MVDDVDSISKSLGWDVVDELIAPQDEPRCPEVAKVMAAKPDVFITALGNDPWEISAIQQITRPAPFVPADQLRLRLLERAADAAQQAAV